MSRLPHAYCLSRNKSTFEAIREIMIDYLELIHNLLFILSHIKQGLRYREKIGLRFLFLDSSSHHFIYITLYSYICMYIQYRKSGLAHKHGNYPLNLQIILNICTISENFFSHPQTT